MKRLIPFLLSCILVSGLQAQTEEAAVIKTIETLFDAMRAGDSATLKSVFDPNAQMMTTFVDRQGNRRLHKGSLEEFAQQVGTPHDAVFDERIWSYKVDVDGLLASAWTEYSFYLGDKFLHCGVNAFQLFHSDAGWKIINITDTRRRSNCWEEAPSDSTLINNLMDQWHKAAAKADEEVFFGSMTEDGIYLGTDASERWLRDDMKEWSKPYFAKETAWDFTPSDRVLYFADDGETVWFEEKLDTWMGTCRGSGIVRKTTAGWKLAHYNLAILVPNDKVKAYLEVLKK